MNNISELSKADCCGCSACAHSCPFSAIEMRQNSEGFYYPCVDADKCTNCGKCTKVCPVLKDKPAENVPKPACYAVWAEDALRLESSSGGMFTLLAEAVLEEGGVVCGVILNQEYAAEHVFVEKASDLAALRGSKYIQSNIGDAFPKIREYLKTGRKVLFTGTPCQTAGLTSYLGKVPQNLLTVDLVCHGAASPKIFRQYLEETFGIRRLKNFRFRTKKYGYGCTTCVAELKDGREIARNVSQDVFEKGFHNSLFLRKSCGECRFASLPRSGDFTIGDFWGISKFDPGLNDQKGTSLVLLNTEKAEKFFEKIRVRAKRAEEVPLDVALKNNRFGTKIRVHPQRDRFFQMASYTTVHKAVYYCMENRYDVGILGVWFGNNYGSVGTYYALMKMLEGMGLCSLMVDKPGMPMTDREFSENNHARKFANEYFHISERYSLEDMKKLNLICDSFVIGSDQVWNYGVCRGFGHSFLLDFARDEKKKVSMAASFGHDKDFRPAGEREISKNLFKRFDAVSVREKSAVPLMTEMFGVKATRVLDPVFCVDRKLFDEIADTSARTETEPYMLTYILDPTPEKKEAITYMAEKLGLRMLHILDGQPWTTEENRKKMNMENMLENINFPDWLNYIRNSSYVITDSCHGMSFSIIYQKPFAGIGNVKRGMTRFTSLVEVFELQDRLVTDPGDIIKNEVFLKPIDYSHTNRILERERERSVKWLRNAMFRKKKVKSFQAYPVEVTLMGPKDTAVRQEMWFKAFFKSLYYRMPESRRQQVKRIVLKYLPFMNR